MTLKGGYHGKLLRINLSERTAKTEAIPDKILVDYIGGRGLGAKLLYDETPKGTNPLGPENKLYFITGALNGVNAPTTSRYTVVTKAPLSGTITSSSSGGHFGYSLKATGFDVIAIEGKASSPVYISVNNQNVEIKDAGHLWGKDVHEASDILIQKYGEKAGIAAIGVAGEQQVLLASIMNEKNHAAGRSGIGAVLGSKMLKAIVVNGDTKTPTASEEAVKEAIAEWRRYIGEAPLTKDVLKEYGTPVLVNVINNLGAYPTKNFQDGVFLNYPSTSPETFKELHFVKRSPCHGCPIGCARITQTVKAQGKGPEYETIWAFGGLCLVENLEKIIHANYACNQYGLDTISTGSTIACAMELSEKGYFDKEAMDLMREAIGKDLKFGDEDAIVTLSEKIGKAEGIGKILGMGSKRLAEKYGHPELSMTVKGLEIPAYDPRGLQGMALSYATCNRGGCHLRGYLVGAEAIATPFEIDRFSSQGKPGLVKLFQDNTAVIDSLGACIFTQFAINPDHYALMWAAVTGIETTGDEILKKGERIWNLERLYNMREGFTLADDTLPNRILNEPFKFGHSKGRNIVLKEMLDEYFKLRNWTAKGEVSKEKIDELGL
ncbi:MAG: aldehyde ferredoxin oxidoreductase family protein [Bacteroidetes bacterium]|nr:aldehyde ferredoxin oxidoreductase family protein [Bacteroidota bacterium]